MNSFDGITALLNDNAKITVIGTVISVVNGIAEVKTLWNKVVRARIAVTDVIRVGDSVLVSDNSVIGKAVIPKTSVMTYEV